MTTDTYKTLSKSDVVGRPRQNRAQCRRSDGKMTTATSTLYQMRRACERKNLEANLEPCPERFYQHR